MIQLKRNRTLLIASVIMTVFLVASFVPAQGAITYGKWRDINPTQYSTDVRGTLRGVYIRNGGSGAINAGDGWVVGGDSSGPIVAHYDGFSWEFPNGFSISNAIFDAVHFCKSPGAPGVGSVCDPNGDGSDGWFVGGMPSAGPPDSPVAVYWSGSGLPTQNTNGLSGAGELFGVFMVCHSPQYGIGCSGSFATAGLTYAAGSDAGRTAGVVYAFSGNPIGPPTGGWTLQFTSALTTRFRSIYMFVDQNGQLGGFAVGDGGVIARLNSGSWSESVVATGVTFRSVFVDSGNPIDAWAVGDALGGSAQIWHFSSGTWAGPTSPGATSNNLNSVFLTSTSEGWAVGSAGTILHSTNLGSGNVWTELTDPLQTAIGSGIDLLGVSFPSGGNGWAVGTQGVILNTQNSNCGPVTSPCWGGNTGITQSPNLRTVFEVSSSDAWAGGDFDSASNNIALMHWDGNKWHRGPAQPPASLSGGPFNMESIYMLGSGEGWAVGGSTGGTIPVAMKWTGSVWDGSAASVAACGCTLNSVFMINSGEGWAVGTGGNIMHFTPGAWGTYASPTTNILNSVFISNNGNNPNAGWAVGNAGTVLELSITSGVATWNVVHPQGYGTVNLQNLYGVYFTDANHGWIVGDQGTILSTTDGGTNWSGGPGQVIGIPTATLRSVFIDTYGTGSGNGDGWAVGDDGSVSPGPNALFVHWEGNSWTPITISPALANGLAVYSVTLKSPTDGWAVGVGVTVGSPPVPLAGVFHLDPPNPPVAEGGGGGATTVITTTTGPSTTSSTESGATSATNAASTSTSTQVESTTVTSSAVSTGLLTSTSTVQSTALSLNTLQLPGIPGFPWESIILGIVVGLTALVIARRHRARN
jgi:photosystem II stability/assembly factor-like uncharacterized protein